MTLADNDKAPWRRHSHLRFRVKVTISDASLCLARRRTSTHSPVVLLWVKLSRPWPPPLKRWTRRARHWSSSTCSFPRPGASLRAAAPSARLDRQPVLVLRIQGAMARPSPCNGERSAPNSIDVCCRAAVEGWYEYRFPDPTSGERRGVGTTKLLRYRARPGPPPIP